MSDSDEAPREFVDLAAPQYVEEALRRREGVLTGSGALCVDTGRRRARSPGDRFIVREPSSEDAIDWGPVNRPFDAGRFDALWERVEAHLGERDQFLAHLHVAAHGDHYLPLELRCDLAWHALFARSLLTPAAPWNPERKPQWRVLCAARFSCDPQRDGSASDATVIIHFARRRILLAGMRLSGELKHAVFTVQNFLLPEKDVLPMHCAASRGPAGDTALFFGASGSGKSTLSTDPERPLIGDDEHGWARGELFRLEGGCYAHIRDLQRRERRARSEPLRFGAIVENAAVDARGAAPVNSGRCCIPLDHLPGRVAADRCAAPRHIFFLCRDIAGVLPALAILSPQAAAFHFLAGYASRGKPAGDDDPRAMYGHFSACFSALQLPRRPRDYAELLSRRIEESGSTVYLVNTGFLGPPAGTAARGRPAARQPLSLTRALIDAALADRLQTVPRQSLSALNLAFPRAAPGVDAQLLDPRASWPDGAAYDDAARALGSQLRDAVLRFDPPGATLAAGPPAPGP